MANRRFGLIGTGFMGKAHAIALRSVATVFPNVEPPVLACLVDRDAAHAERVAADWGFEHATTDWRELCDDPEIDVVDICTPNHLHFEMAMAAIEAGKHVYCEKPLALSGDEARKMYDAAEAANVRTAVGFNYICNPMLDLARDMIAGGEIGTVFNFRGSYQEDYLADPGIPFSWRCLRAQGGSGALNDLGTHLINMAEYLLGPIASVLANLTTVHSERTDAETGQARAVENEDIAQVLMKFANQCSGTMEISRVATGRKCGLCFEIHGSQGAIVFDQERMNELRLYRNDDAEGRRGFRTVLAGPEHQHYGQFCPAPGHGLGINDLKVIEVLNFLQSIDSNGEADANFETGWRVQHIVDSIEQSHINKEWINIETTT